MKQLESKAWFKKEGWRGRVALYTKMPPVVTSIHIYKDNWHNNDRGGIHFETFVGPKEHKSKSVAVVLHLLHTPTIPGTKIKRGELSKLVVDEAFDMISEWPGYKFRVGKYGMQPFTKNLKFEEDTLVTLLAAEFTRLCKNLGPVIDSSLQELQKS